MQYSYDGTNYVRESEAFGREMIGPEVAISFSPDDGDKPSVLMKHGKPELVRAHAEKFRAALAGHPGLDDIQVRVISGKFPVEELNRIIDITGYVDRFVRLHSAPAAPPAPEPSF